MCLTVSFIQFSVYARFVPSSHNDDSNLQYPLITVLDELFGEVDLLADESFLVLRAAYNAVI